MQKRSLKIYYYACPSLSYFKIQQTLADGMLMYARSVFFEGEI